MNYLFVAVGGAFGAILRYGFGSWVSNKWIHAFPLHTFIINISGAFLLGFLNTLFLDKLTVSPEIRLALGIGFIGAFTTFSTFGYENIMLIKDGQLFTAGIYTLFSIIIGFLGVYLGMELARLM
ncbi:MAG: fluoride efflux transporter CrcB [Peptococcaceae bacterium]|nr:fluoride efflux transporter CrcB [Peptococcaceae bacterium]